MNYPDLVGRRTKHVRQSNLIIPFAERNLIGPHALPGAVTGAEIHMHIGSSRASH